MANMFRLEELGTTKQAVRRCFKEHYERPADDVWANQVTALLESKRTEFTLDELEALIDVFSTSHHNCVLENDNEFHRLTVAAHRRLEKKFDRWHEYIRQRRLADAGLQETQS